MADGAREEAEEALVRVWKPEEFAVGMVIHPAIARLPEPKFLDEIIATPLAISARNEIAQKHVHQGIAYIQAAWDHEAYRHFCEAARADPDCLMAYWGIGMALAAPNNEFVEQRMAAVNRMLDLLKAGKGTPQERQYAMSLAALYTGNAQAASEAFKKLAERFPKDLQARLIATYFLRDGFTEFGDPLEGQKKAMDAMAAIVRENPDNVAVLAFWVMLHAEHPDASEVLRYDVLPVARKLVRLVPGFAPYLHMLGHLEWRCGNHLLATQAFERAVNGYGKHMQENKMSFHDCDGYLRSKIYLATAYASLENFREALKLARQLAALQVEEKRLDSAGANLVVWQGRTLPARLYMARGWDDDFARALETFPEPGDPQLFKGRTLSLFWLEALRQYVEARRALVEGDRDEARNYHLAMEETLAGLAGMLEAARGSSAISDYLRSLRAIEVLSAELRGFVALSGEAGEKNGAYNWFKSATEKQGFASLLNAPLIPYPMQSRLGDFYSRTGRPEKSVTAYEGALEDFPNDLRSLRLLKEALIGLGRTADAEAIEKQIGFVTGG